MKDSVEVTITDKPLRRFLESEFPKILNSRMNRGYARSGAIFSKEFAQKKFEGAGAVYRVRRKNKKRKAGRGQPALRRTFQLAGFRGRLTGMKKLEGKQLSISTSSPILLQLERGGVINPKATNRLGLLLIRIRRKGGAAKKRAFDFFAVRQVVVKARLGFIRAWRSFQPTVIETLDKALLSATGQAQKAMDRATSKARSKRGRS